MIEKRVLILNTSHNDLYSIKALKKMGFYVIATGGKKGLIGEQFVDEYFQMDYSEKEEILKFAETKSIDYICACCNDFGVMTASFVAEKLGLSGHDSYENTLILHHKDMFKNFAKENNIFTPPAEYFSSENTALDYIEIAEFPIIVKPTDLSAGNGVSQAENKEQAVIAIKNAFAKSRVKKIIIEPFIEGSQHGFCTFLINKKVTAVCSNNEYSFVNPYRIEIDTYPADNFDEVKDFLIGQIEKMADILNLKDGIFHLQYRMKDDKPYIIECMRRTLGNMYGVPAKKLTGIDWDYWQMAVYCGLDLSVFPKNTEQGKFCAYKTIMAKQNGYVKSIIIPKDIEKFVHDTHFLWKPENPIEDYMSEPLGFLFMEFPNMETMKNVLLNRYDEISLEYQGCKNV
jgi:biotin carboxylase